MQSGFGKRPAPATAGSPSMTRTGIFTIPVCWGSCSGSGRLSPLTMLLAWVVGAACLVAGRAPAADAPVVVPPPVAVAVAAAETDSEVNLWLARAVKAMRTGDHDNALPLLLRLFRTPPPALASTNGTTFTPARKLAAELIRKLPEETLAAHSLRADTPRDIAPTDLETLEAHYNRLLPGIAAMQTGLRLAGLYIDRERFRDARRLLIDVLELNPETGPFRSQLLARLTLTCARVEDMARAEWAWAELRKEGETNRWSLLGTELRPAAPPTTPASNAWTMAYGGPARWTAPTPPHPEQGTNNSWALLWGLNLEPGMVRGGEDAEKPADLPPNYSVGRSYATTYMTGMNHRPADDIIFAGNRAWVNGFAECVAVDLDSGRVHQRTAHQTDDPAKGLPSAARGIWVFGNRMNRAASLIGRQVYCVEDNYRSSLDSNMRTQSERVEGKEVHRPLPRGNALAAYEADTGRPLWRIGRELPTEAPANPHDRWRANAICFTAAPVPCGGLLLAPVEDDSGLSVVGLDAHSGSQVWRARLTSQIPATEVRASPLNVTVDGATAYLCSGDSSVSRLDGCDGSVLWTALYKPFAAANPVDNGGGILWTNLYAPLRVSSTTIPVTRWIKPETRWEESLTMVFGETVVAMPEDSHEILAFDRRNGARLWTQPKPDGVNYVVGRRAARLIVAGRRTVACVDLADGQVRWRTPIEGSTGRGALRGTEVLIPHGDRILRLRAEDGVALDSAPAQTFDGFPLGNLYVNGNQLLVAGLDRLHALADARPAFARLGERLSRQPDAEAYAERGRLYAGLERYKEAAADLREAWKRQRGSAAEEAARGPLLMALWSAADRDPGVAESFCAEAREIAATATERAEATWRWAQCRARAGNTNGALTMYAAVFGVPDVPLTPDANETDRKASAHRLAARRIRTLAATKGWALLEEPAAQALARLEPTADCAALVDMATFFPGTLAGKEAAIKASGLAAGRGDLGTAEAILQRALALSTPSNRVALAEQLVRLYDRMKWPRGAAQLRDEWPRLGDGAPAPEFLARAATNAIEVPLPPWRLRWEKRLPDMAGARLVGAGLLYTKRDPNGRSTGGWRWETKQAGCLDLESGEPRWQRDGVLTTLASPAGNDSHLLIVYTGNGGACLDTWSGAITTNALFRGPVNWVQYPGGHAKQPMTLNRVGLTTTRPFQLKPPAFRGRGLAVSMRDLAGVDVLTGKTAWRRRDMDTLLGSGMWHNPVSSSAAGVFLMSSGGGPGTPVVALDPWTGAATGRRTFGGVYGAWARCMSGRRGREDPHALDVGSPTLKKQRLVLENARTGASIWRSPADITIVKQTVLDGGTILAQTDADELLLIDGMDGRITCRSGDIRLVFKEARFVGNAVIASRGIAEATREVIVLDPTVGKPLFHGRLPEHARPLMSLGPAMPDQLLVQMGNDSDWISVINTQGKITNKKWRIPTSGGYPIFADNLILMFGGDLVRAYEHDPGDGAETGGSVKGSAKDENSQ